MKQVITASLGIAFNEKGQVLLTQRYQPDMPVSHLKWQTPGGGVEFGEHPLETLKREIYEEVGVRCEVLDERPLVNISMWDFGNQNEIEVILLSYIISIGEQTPNITDVETNDWRWVDVDKVDELQLLPEVSQTVRKAYQIFLMRT